MSSGKNGKSLFCSYKELEYVHRMSWKFLLVLDEAKEDMEQGAVSRVAPEMIVGNGSLEDNRETSFFIFEDCRFLKGEG